MGDWWSYRPSSFLLFSERTYRRLFERYNGELWPAQALALALGVALLALVLRGGTGAWRIVLTILAAAWLWVAWGFLAERYVSINWAAAGFVGAFAVEAAALLIAALAGARAPLRVARTPRAIALGLLLLALVAWPAFAWLPGRGVAAAEVFGLAPDPTVLATFGVLALLRVEWPMALRWPQRLFVALLWLVPLAWCAFSTTLLMALHAPEAWLLPLAALLALIAAARR